MAALCTQRALCSLEQVRWEYQGMLMESYRYPYSPSNGYGRVDELLHVRPNGPPESPSVGFDLRDIGDGSASPSTPPQGPPRTPGGGGAYSKGAPNISARLLI